MSSEPDSVRPYVITGGRTRATDDDLPVETVVMTATSRLELGLDFERRSIAELCVEPLSIAELASALDLPLGVTRVLVSEMTAAGLLRVSDGADPDDVELIEQLREAIRLL